MEAADASCRQDSTSKPGQFSGSADQHSSGQRERAIIAQEKLLCVCELPDGRAESAACSAPWQLHSASVSDMSDRFRGTQYGPRCTSNGHHSSAQGRLQSS